MKLIYSLLSILIFCSLHAENTNGNPLLAEANELRESGETLRAIDTYNKAIVAFQKEKNTPSTFSALIGHALSWKHLFYETEDPLFALFFQKDVELLQKLNEQHRLNREHTVHYLLGTADYLQGNYPTAEKELQKAIEFFPTDHPEKADWKAHLGEVMILNGKKEQGKVMVVAAIKTLESQSNEMDSFLNHVWLSGAYLRLAKALKTSDLEESALYLQKAKKIISEDKRLFIRQKQIDKL